MRLEFLVVFLVVFTLVNVTVTVSVAQGQNQRGTDGYCPPGWTPHFCIVSDIVQ